MKIVKAIVLSKKKILCAIGGIAALAVLLHTIPPTVQSVFGVHTAEAERKLPIYCVETPEKKVAISFDAAWDACYEVRREEI